MAKVTLKELLQLLEALADTSKVNDWELERLNIDDYNASRALDLVSLLLTKNIPFVPIPILDHSDGDDLLRLFKQRVIVRDSISEIVNQAGEECQCDNCQAERALKNVNTVTGNKTKH